MATVNQYRISETDRFFSTANANGTINVVAPDSDVNIIKSLIYINGKAVSVGGMNLNTTAYPPLNSTFTNGRYYHIHFDASTYCYVAITVSGNTENIVYYPSTHSVYALQQYDKPDKLAGNDTSYELLRANPKLTGNIKVVVDSSSNMYLDTFKVSTALSQSQYRHIPINPDEYYGNTLMNNIKVIPSDDLYKIEDGCYELFAPASDLGSQYYDTYNSGVRTNNDSMYSENFAMLAPLCVKKHIPDFFLIFKIDGYDNLDSSNLLRMDYFLRNATLVKSFDLRSGSNVGKYIRTIYEKSKSFVGDLFVGYDYDSYNTYNAISIDRGVVAKIYESTSAERSFKNQVAMNDWYTLGYQRNHIVSKDIINLEFMFDDKDASMFSLHTYFGLYVRLNGLDGGFSCINKTDSDGVVTYSFDKTPKGSGTPSFNPADYKNYIYGYSTNTEFVRTLFNIKYTGQNDIEQYLSKPDGCIATPDVEEPLGIEDSFCSVHLNDVANPGEHYRIIDGTHKLILEVLISNHSSQSNLSEITESYHTYNIDASAFTIRRISVFNNGYRKNIPDASKSEIIKQQIAKIADAFNALGNDSSILDAYNNGEDCFSIIYHSQTDNNGTLFTGGLDKKICMEKVDSVCGFTHIQNTYITSSEYVDESTSFFGMRGNRSFVVTSNDPQERSLYYPVDFEHFGYRRATAVKFVPTKTLDGSSVSSLLYNISDDITDTINGIDTTLYKSNAGDYDLFNTLNQHLEFRAYFYDPTQSDTSVVYKTCVPGYGNGKHYVVRTKTKAATTRNKMYFYKSYILNSGLCSIFPVKDFNFTVLDTVSNFTLNNNDKDGIVISNNPGEYQKTDNAFGTSIASGTEESLCHYIDKYQLYDISGNHYVQLPNLSNYLYNLSINNHKKSDISLISPYCCKWQLVGTDHRGLPMRVMYPLTNNNGISTLSSGDSYYIPDTSLAYIGYPTVPTNVINRDGDSSTDTRTENVMAKYVGDLLVRDEYPAYRKYVLEGNGRLDDILFGDADRKNKWSKAYSYGNDTLEFVSGGLKIRITSNNKSIINFANYNGYSAALICMSGSNPLHEEPCEIIVDETTEQLFYVIYNGTNVDIMTYNENKRIYNATGIPHHSAISECAFKYINGYKKLVVPDDGKFYNDTSLYVGEGYFVMSSPQKEFDEYTAEKYIMLYGSIKDDKVYNTQDTEHLYIGDTGNDIHIFVDSSMCSTTDYTLKNLCNKYNNNVDVMIFSTGVADSSNRTTGKPYTLDVVKSIINSTAIQIKTNHGTKDLTGIDGLVSINIVEPYTMSREDGDYNEVTSGKVYPGFSEPVMSDVLEFPYSSDSSINHLFGSIYDGCNLTISEVNDIYQTWLRKVIVPSAKLRVSATGSIIEHTENTNISLRLKELGYVDAKPIPNTTSTYSQVVDSVVSNFQIESVDLNLYQEFTVGISTQTQLTKRPTIGDILVGYNIDDGTKIGTYYVKNDSSIDSSIIQDVSVYTGSFLVMGEPDKKPIASENGLDKTQFKFIDDAFIFHSPRLQFNVNISDCSNFEFDYTGLCSGDVYTTTQEGETISFKIITFDLEEDAIFEFTINDTSSPGPRENDIYRLYGDEELYGTYRVANDDCSSGIAPNTNILMKYCDAGAPIFPSQSSTWKFIGDIIQLQSPTEIDLLPIANRETYKGSGIIIIENLYNTKSSVELPPSGRLYRSSGYGPSIIPFYRLFNEGYLSFPVSLTQNNYTITDASDGSTYPYIFKLTGYDRVRGNYTKLTAELDSSLTLQLPQRGYLKNTQSLEDSSIYYNKISIDNTETNEFNISTVNDGSVYYHGGTVGISPLQSTYQLIPNDSSIYIYTQSGIDASNCFLYSDYNTIEDSSTTTQTTRYIKMTSSMYLIHDLSPMVNCWQSNLYRIYTDYDDYVHENGTSSGYEKNTFFSSRGLSLKKKTDCGLSRSIIQTEWKDFVIDDVNYTITIDLTTTLVNMILISDGYVSNWNNMGDSTNTADKAKTNYIENSILKYIKINNSTKVKVYRVFDSSTFGFSSLDEINIDKYVEETNVTVSLSHENDKYYMTFSGLGKYQYSAKITFND